MEDVLEYLSNDIKKEINNYLYNKMQNIEEIRLRINRPIVIKTEDGNVVLNHTVKMEELLETFQRICEHSIYAYQKQICEGFITIKGGHRIGVTGSSVIENDKIININYISSLNIRIAKQKKDSSNIILKYVIENNKISNTIIASKPGCGKTTILRDLVRKISTGIPEYNLSAKTCGIVDERGEIAAMYKGVPQNDIGTFSDVIENSPKYIGMRMLIRSMAPEVIICDEIGSEEDIEAISYAMSSGVKGIFTLHANTLEDIYLNKNNSELLKNYIIETIIFLDEKKRGNIKEIYKLNKENKSYIKVPK